MTVIAVVAMGEMGSGIGRRIVEGGARAITSLAGRSKASFVNAEAAGVAVLDDEALVAEADMLLSVVPPAAAEATAQRFLPLIERADRKPVFIDGNAIAPQTLHRIAAPFLASRLPFIDLSIIGAAPKSGGPSPRLYMSGAIGREAGILRDLGLDTRVLSDTLGDASALKMSYAGITKGFQALATAMALGAARSGAGEALVAELRASQPALHAWLQKQLPVMYPKAYRWDGEMREIAAFLDAEAGGAEMFAGAAELYQHVAAAHRAGPASPTMAALDRFVGR